MVIDDGGFPARCFADRDQTTIRRVVHAVGARLHADALVGHESLDGVGQSTRRQRQQARELVRAQRARLIDLHPNQRRVRFAGVDGGARAELLQLLGGGHPITRVFTLARAADQAARDQVVQYAAHLGFFVALEVDDHFGAAGRRHFGQIGMHGAPQGEPLASRRLCQALHLLLIRAQGQTEHVGDDLLADALALELTHEADEHLVGDVRKRRANAIDGRQLRDQNHRLAHDCVDQYLCVHAKLFSGSGDVSRS